MKVGCFGRIRELGGLTRRYGNKRVGRLHEEERRLAVRIVAHLPRMSGIVAPNAINPAHGIHALRTDNGQSRTRWLWEHGKHKV
jgi:hypothetical protein